MQLSRNALLVITIALVVVVAAFLYLNFKPSNQPVTTAPPTANNQPAVTPPANNLPTTDEAQVERLSRIFLERYASYSSQAAGQNIESLKSILTTDLYNQFKAKITGGTGQLVTAVARAASISDIKITGASATSTVTGNQQKTVASQTATVDLSYRLSFRKISNQWVITQVNP